MVKATTPRKIDEEDEFSRAALGQQGEGKAGTSEGPQPKTHPKVGQYRRQEAQKHDHVRDRGR
jgi:hypothetical protein